MKHSILLKFVIVAIIFTMFSCKEEVTTVSDNAKTTSTSQEHPNLI